MGYETWLHQQLEPDNILRTGNRKRHKPLFAEISDMLDKMTPEQRAEMAMPHQTTDQQDQWCIENEKRLGL